jgi:hypothetical protein
MVLTTFLFTNNLIVLSAKQSLLNLIINFHSTVALRNTEVFWNVTPRHWAGSSRYFEKL